MSNELTILIDKLVEDKTFSLEGVKAITQLKDKAILQEKKIEELESYKKDAFIQILTIENDKKDLESKLRNIEEREKKVRDQEIAIEVIKTKLDMLNATKKDLFDLVGMIFKSPIIRENVIGNVPVSPGPNGQYPVTIPTNQSTTREEM